MKKTFRERAIIKFTTIAKTYKKLHYPCLILLSVILGIYHAGRHFATNSKRYASVAFVVGFFMSSCSFSFAVFAERTSFTKAQDVYG